MWNDTSHIRSKPTCPDYRHVEAFRRAYVEHDFTRAADAMFSSKRSIARLLKDMENICGGRLFNAPNLADLSPTPLGDRLFTDTGNLERAMEALLFRIKEIRDQGRILRVSTTPGIFRSDRFREIFRDLQAANGIRLSFVPSLGKDPGKDLAQGKYDLFLGLSSRFADRFSYTEVAKIPLHGYLRGVIDQDKASGDFYTLDSIHTTPAGVKLITDEDWLHWLDNPLECPTGTRLVMPAVSTDARFWTEIPIPADWQQSARLHATYLHQHPYEFLPRLCSELKSRFLT